MGCNESKVENSTAKGQVKSQPAQSRSNKVATSPQTSKTQQPMEKSGSSEDRPPIKFSHFNDEGRCVPLLMIFDYAGIKYENDVIALENWPTVKPKTAMGTLPILKVGSEELVSSLAILKYLGGEADLLGSTAEEQAAIDAMVYMIEDCRGGDLFLSRFLLLTNEMSDETRAEKEKAYTEGCLATLINYLEKNMTGKKWIFQKLSIADFWLYGTLKAACESLVPNIWSMMNSNVQEWRTNFESIPQVAQYLKKKSEPRFKFTYFEGVRGRVEPYRMMCALGHVNYENHGIPTGDWPQVKPTTVMGYLPILEVDGQEITTSLAILGYLGRETGLMGGEDECAVTAAAYMIEDCRSVVFPSRFAIRTGNMNDEEKAEKQKAFLETALPTLTNYLDNNTKCDKWLFDQLTIADFWLYGTLEIIEDSLEAEIWSKMNPKIQSWRTNIESLPAVKAYLESRPAEYFL